MPVQTLISLFCGSCGCGCYIITHALTWFCSLLLGLSTQLDHTYVTSYFMHWRSMLPTIGSRQSDVFYVTSALGSAVTAYGLGRSECGSRRMYVHVHVSIAPWQIMQGCVLFACSGWCWRYEEGNDLRWRRRATTRYTPATWRHHAQ